MIRSWPRTANSWRAKGAKILCRIFGVQRFSLLLGTDEKRGNEISLIQFRRHWYSPPHQQRQPQCSQRQESKFLIDTKRSIKSALATGHSTKKKQPPRSEVVNFSLLMLNKMLPGCFCLGFGKFVTHVCGHMRMLHGCREPSRKCCLVCEIWIPPNGVFGNVLAGTRARQYTPTWWMLSIA